MVVNRYLEGLGLVLFEINYSKILNFLIIHQEIKNFSLSIHNDSLWNFYTKNVEILFAKLDFWDKNKIILLLYLVLKCNLIIYSLGVECF